MKKSVSIFLILCILLTFAACGKRSEANTSLDDEQATQNTGQAVQNSYGGNYREGWLMSRVDMPAKMPVSTEMDYDGDCLWLSGRSQVDGAWRLLLLGLDTTSGQWTQITLDLTDIGVSDEYDIRWASIYGLSVRDGMAWMYVYCTDSDYSLSAYRLVTVDTVTKEVNATEWNWEKAFSSADQYILALTALSRDQALIITETEACIIDRGFNLLAQNSIEAYMFGDSCSIGDQLYLISDDGITRFDTQSLSLDRSIDFDPVNWAFSVADSLPGNILYSVDGKLYSVQDSGQSSLVFDWMDVAISRNTIAPALFENSKGEYYGCADSGNGLELVKVTRAQIPVKDTLRLACFIDTQTTDPRSFMGLEMKDAILAYNNSAAAYRIEPVYFEYAGDRDLDRALIEAFNADIDLVDQSNLPEGRISVEQLMDLLPYLDADPELDREDFFPAALRGMCAGGRLYRIDPSFTTLGLRVPKELYTEPESWSCTFLERAIASDPSLAMGWSERYTQEWIVHAMACTITGEFIELDSMSCDFTRKGFTAWLGLMTSLMGETGLAEDKVVISCSVEDYYMAKRVNADMGIEEISQFVGFPDSKGSGVYLLSQAAEKAVYGGSDFSSLSVAKSCKNGQAAWDFAKLLLQRAGSGVPVLRSRYESLMENHARTIGMDQKDIDELREMVENAAGTVIADPALIDVIVAELNAFVHGKQSAQETAGHLQSRVGIYLAERG